MSSRKNDCANGSGLPPKVCRTLVVVFELANSLAALLPEASNVWTLAFLNEIIFSWTVSNVPVESNTSWAVVDALSKLFWSLSINTNVLLPVSNVGFDDMFGFGMNKLPRTDAA